MDNVKYLLTVKEAALIFGIGQHSLRALGKSDYNRIYTVMVGNRLMFKRDRFKQFLDESQSIPSFTN